MPNAPKPTPVIATAFDVDVFARTIFGEARGETMQGQIAVANVILNRVRIAQAYFTKNGKSHPLYGSGTIGSACKARLQFSCWNQGDPTYRAVVAANLDDARLQRATCAALMVLHGQAADNTSGSTHYHTPAVSPPWSRGKTPLCTIGGHLFFNDID
ncbi:cell wall hydrolase [Oleomonas cavernae]|nr:cell wall hydrolase [Oleomonas cavernae]